MQAPMSLLRCFAVTVHLAGCAIPATQVQVPTESMHEALQQARSARKEASAPQAPPYRNAHMTVPPGAPRPVLAAPDIRMAYLYDWIDHEGNQHFAGWVAIPLAGFDWIINQGAAAPTDSPQPAAGAHPERLP